METESALNFGPYQLDRVNERLWRGTQILPLRPKPFAILCYLVEHPGRLISKAELLRAIWPDTTVNMGVLKSYIHDLRTVLGDDVATPQFLETVARRGYRFIAKVVSSQHSVASSQQTEGMNLATQDSALRTQHSVLVGREPELAQLHDCLDKALHGERQIVFVTGEPGIGKTALVDTFLREIRDGARQRGDDSRQDKSTQQHATDTSPTVHVHDLVPQVWVGGGQCIEQYGIGEVYLPVLSALGQVGREPEGHHLLTLLHQHAPSWLVQLPAVLTDEELGRLQRKTAGVTKARMLRELGEALEVLTTARPLVLVLEDLHWADPSTLELLAFVARRTHPARLLILGTYRPAEMLSAGSPLQGVVQELYAHGLGRELPLGVLSEEAIAQYLDGRFGGQPTAPLPSLASLLQQRTGGNPLFLVSMVNDWIAGDVLRQTATGWEVQEAALALESAVPDSIRHLVARQSGRLSVEEQHTLEAASVAGMEFSAAAVAAALTTETPAVERRCEQLAQRQQFLKRLGVEAWPDGTLAARYGFLHALYQHLWHERVTPTQRQRFHRHIGERKEHAYGERAREIAAELAMHFEEGRESARAIPYLRAAGDNAVRRSAHQEAIRHFLKALALLKTVPATPRRIQQELEIQAALCLALMVGKGEAALEVKQAYGRALALCQQVGDTPQLFPVLWGLWAAVLVSAEFRHAHTLGERLLSLARGQPDTGVLLEAHFTLGDTLFWLGQLHAARTHLEHGIALYDPQRHHSHIFSYGQDPGVFCLSYAALTLWMLGYPEQAFTRNQEALALAHQVAHPYTMGWALFWSTGFHHLRRERRDVQDGAEALVTLCSEQGFQMLLAFGYSLRGWALAEQGQGEEGINQIQKGFSGWRSAGSEIGTTWYLALLSEALGRGGQTQHGLHTVSKALAFVDRTGEGWYEAELYRLKGELLLQQGARQHAPSELSRAPTALRLPPGEIEECFHKAIGIARRQHARMWELRATVSLARLWQQQGKQREAGQMVAEIYGWFTEGFDTKDLQEAKALLEELS